MGPVAGVFATMLWLFWIIYVLTAFVFILAVVVTLLAAWWIRHDWRAYKYRKAKRAAETQN